MQAEQGPLETAFLKYVSNTHYVKAKSEEMERLASRLASITHERDEMARARDDAFAVMEKYLTPEGIAELKAVRP